MVDSAFKQSAVIAASTDLHQKLEVRHSHHANPWGTWEELLLASAVQRYGNDNWVLIATELQLRIRPSFSFTPEACQAKYESIKLRFGFDEAREEGNGTLWFEELRKLRVAHLKQELEQYDNSIGSLEKKIRRLQSEKATSTKDKGLTLGYGGAIEPKRTPFGACERGRNVVLVESGFSQTHSDLATPASTDASVCVSAQFNKDIIMVQPNVGRRLLHEGSGLTLAKGCNNKAGMVQLNVGEPPCLDLSQLNDGARATLDLQTTEESTWQKKGDHCAGVLGVVRGAQIEGFRDSKDGETVEGFVRIEKNERGEQCNAAETDLKTCISRHVGWCSGTKQAACTVSSGSESGARHKILECCPRGTQDEDGAPRLMDPQSLEDLNVAEPGIDGVLRLKNAEVDCDRQLAIGDQNKCLSSKKVGVLATKQSPSSEWADSTVNEHQHARAAKNVCQEDSTSNMATQDVSKDSSDCKVKVKMLTAEDTVSEPVIRKLKGGMQTLATRDLAVATPHRDSKSHSAGSTENSSPQEVSGESLDTQAGLAKRKERLFVGGKIQKLSLSFTENLDEMRDASVPFTPVEYPVKSESITTSNEASDSVHASGSSGGNDDNSEAWQHIERFSRDSRVENSELSSLLDGSENNSPMSKRNKREPKVAGKLIPLLDSLRNVCAHKCASSFKHSRDIQNDQRYHLMIRTPTDLGTIRVKLEEGQYSGSLDFFRDLLLMVSNALVYYSKDSSESAAASGLRECILREMAFIFKAEVLVKQEGPAFRKRDTGKVRQLSPGKPGIGTQMSTPSTGGTPVKDLVLKQCDASMNVGCQDNQRNSTRPDEGASTATVMTGKKDGSISDAKILLEHDSNKPKGAFRSVPSKKARRLVKASTSAPEDTKDGLAESLDNEEWSSPEARTPTTTTGALSKSVECCSDKIIAHRTPEALKRGVGRPPKHSHNQDLQRLSEAYKLPGKKFKR